MQKFSLAEKRKTQLKFLFEQIPSVDGNKLELFRAAVYMATEFTHCKKKG